MDGASARAGVAGSKPSRTSIGRHSGRLPRAEVRSNDLYSNRASGGETGGKDMELSRERGALRRDDRRASKLAPQEGSERTNGVYLDLAASSQPTLGTGPSPLTDG